MPLGKRGSAPVVEPQSEQGVVTTSNQQPANAPSNASNSYTEIGATMVREKPMTKDDYWKRREERDVQRDKDMAWSGLAQAALGSVGLVQLNTQNTLEGYIDLVAKATGLLLKARDTHNG